MMDAARSSRAVILAKVFAQLFTKRIRADYGYTLQRGKPFVLLSVFSLNSGHARLVLSVFSLKGSRAPFHCVYISLSSIKAAFRSRDSTFRSREASPLRSDTSFRGIETLTVSRKSSFRSGDSACEGVNKGLDCGVSTVGKFSPCREAIADFEFVCVFFNSDLSCK